MNRTDIINTYAKSINAKSYLEIGVRIANDNFNHIIAPNKVGVDPGTEGVFEGTHKMTSDEYFSQNTDTFDLIFIDGLHEREQVSRDIKNSLNVLNENGVIICHDMNPKMKEHQLPNTDPLRQKYVKEQKELGSQEYGLWTGDCWKSFVYLRSTRSDLEMFVIDTDFGVGVIKKGMQQTICVPLELHYEYLENNREKCLNIKTIEEFMKEQKFFF
jgi:16S rRNA G966 N2-methylase RsmD